LAIWIQDDGHFYHNGIYLNTQSYTIEGLGYLILAFEKNWGIKPEIKKVSGKLNQYRLFISAKYLKKVQGLTKEYITNSMLYKIGI
jgi:hypothetical protein